MILYTDNAQKTNWLTFESVVCNILGLGAGLLLSSVGMGIVCILIFTLWWINYILF